MKNYSVKHIARKETYPWLLKMHYAKRIPSISFAYGLFNYDELVGVCAYGTPASSTLLRGVCGDEYKGSVVELNRLVLKYNKRNEASYFVSKTLKMLPPPKIVVSYADTGQHHFGTVYQALNFVYTGLSSKFVDPKVKGLEHQHHATYAHGMTKKQLFEKFGEKLYFSERDRKHRYIYFTGSKSEIKKMRKSLRYDILPYPKGENKRYKIDYVPEFSQLTLF